MYVKLELVEPGTIDFKPGQFVSVEVDKDTYRAYSIASDPKDADNIELLVEYGHDGIGSNYFKNISIQDNIIFVGPSGRFTLRDPTLPTLNFFATGSGLAPFIPMFERLSDIGYEGSVKLFFGLRYQKDLFYQERLEEFAVKMSDFEYKIYYSQPDDKKLPEGSIYGRITSIVDKVIDKNAHYYLCGNPHMITDIFGKLISSDIEESNIFMEEFTHN